MHVILLALCQKPYTSDKNGIVGYACTSVEGCTNNEKKPLKVYVQTGFNSLISFFIIILKAILLSRFTENYTGHIKDQTFNLQFIEYFELLIKYNISIIKVLHLVSFVGLNIGPVVFPSTRCLSVKWKWYEIHKVNY